jgi:hypothetical protein
MAKKKSKKNPEGFSKACIAHVKNLIRHMKQHPNDNQQGIKIKLNKCKDGTYRKNTRR